MIGLRNDIANTPPVQFGVCKDVSIDFSRKIEKLVGQLQVPVALGAGELEITGKISWARIGFSEFNNLFFGQSGAAAGMRLTTNAPGVAGSVPASSTYTVTPTVPASGTFVEDMGVYYAATGTQLTPSASASGIGIYSVNNGTGVYTFNVADASANLIFFFDYTVATGGTEVTLSNQLMGSAPTWELSCQQQFSQYGVTKQLNLKLFSCMSDKLSFPFKNTGFTELSLGFDIQQNAAGNYAVISVTDP